MTGKQKTIARSIAFNIASFIEKKAAGLFFINGVTFYLKPAEQNMQFGSAELEMTFQYDDTKDTIEQKFIDYFADGFADEVEYTGWDRGREAKNKVLSHVFEKKSRYYREAFSKRSYMHISLSENDIEQIKVRYFNAMTVSKELQKAGDPESRFEAGRAYALEGILRMLGFDYTDMASGRVLEAEQEGGER